MTLPILLLCAAPSLLPSPAFYQDAHGKLVLERAPLVCREKYQGCPTRIFRTSGNRFFVLCRRVR